MAAGGLETIQNMLHKLPQSERKLAEYILKNPHEIVNGTIQEVSSSAKTSGAAAIRLCKSLGLKGFQDLKMRVAGDLMKPSDQGYRDIEPQEPLHSIVQKTTSNSIQAIRDTFENIDPRRTSKSDSNIDQRRNGSFLRHRGFRNRRTRRPAEIFAHQ